LFFNLWSMTIFLTSKLGGLVSKSSRVLVLSSVIPRMKG
jgi:hypothetical protein